MPLDIKITDVDVKAIQVFYRQGRSDQIQFTIDGFQVDSDGNPYQTFQYFQILESGNLTKIQEIVKELAEAYKESVGI